MILEEFGFQPILVETSLPLDQVASLWTTSPDSYRPAALQDQTPNRKIVALRGERPADDEELEPTLQRRLKRTKISSAMADSVPLNHNTDEAFRHELYKAKKTSKDKDVYIPNEALEQLTKDDKIRKVVEDLLYKYSTLPKSAKEFAAKLSKECRILVAICVDAKCVSVLMALVQHGITDKDLPLPAECPESLRGDYHEMDYNNLYERQWRFKAAVFHEVGQHQKFDERVIVPYTQKEQIGVGGSATVYKVRISPSHQKLCSLPGDKNPELALKVIAKSPAFLNERLMLEGLRGIRHNHIISLLGTYEQGDNCHFFFPFADGDLMWLMEQGPNIRNAKSFVPWITCQMKGICDALCNVHKQTPETAAHLNQQIQERATGHLHPSYQEGTGYHHDIKPKNMLYFSVSRMPFDGSDGHPIPNLGIVQLADFGVGKFRHAQSGSGTGTWRGTLTYAAPESLKENLIRFAVSGRNQKIARPYDIWSFGCVLLEILVWIVHGRDELLAFRARRVQPVYEGCLEFKTDAFFYMTESQQPKLKDEVTHCIQKLSRHNHLSNRESSLSGLLNLIEETLKINPYDRMGAADLHTELNRVAERAKIEPPYELTDEKLSFDEASANTAPTSKSTHESYPHDAGVEIRVQPPSN